MRDFLRIIFSFLAVFIILAYCGDFIITSGLNRSDDRKYIVWNDIYRGKISADVVVVGSSRAWTGYNPYILDSVLYCNSYNLGIDGHCLDYQIIRYNTFRRFNAKPNNIILNIDFLSLGKLDEPYEREQFFPYINDDSLISIVKEEKRISILDRYLPLFRYYGYSHDIKLGVNSYILNKKSPDGDLYKGFRGNTYSWNSTNLNSAKIIYYKKDSNSIKLLDSFLAKGKKENVNIVLVLAPVYIKTLEKIYHLNEMTTLYETIAKNHNVFILNYMYDSISYDQSNFYNGSHLNKKGAKLFSSKLARDIKEGNMLHSFDLQ